MSPLTARQMNSTPSSISEKNISPEGISLPTKSGDNGESLFMSVPQEAQDLYPQTHIICSNGIKLQSSTESLVSKIVRATETHQGTKPSGTLANSLRNIKNQIRSNTPLNDNIDDVTTDIESPGIVSNGFIRGKHENSNITPRKSSPFHRPSLAAAIASSSYSGEDRVLTNAVHDPPSNSSKLKAVFQSIKANTNKSKILMVLALCILCLPGNIVTIWLKFTQYEEHVKRSGTTDGWTKNASVTRMSPFIYDKAKEILVLEATNFCMNEFKERNISNIIENGKNETMNKEPRKKLPLAMTDRLQRAASKSKEIPHPFEPILLDRETQNLLEVKFMDCILNEAENNAIGSLNENNTPGKPSSRSFKRGRRMASSKQTNNKPPSIVRHQRNFLKKYNRKKRIVETPLKVKRKTQFGKHLNKDATHTENAFDPHTILEEYYAHYKKDIMASKNKNFEVFCEDNPFDSSSSSSEKVNQTMDNILASLEKHMEKVKESNAHSRSSCTSRNKDWNNQSLGLIPFLCFRSVYNSLFLKEFSFKQLPPWVDVKQKAFRGEKFQEEKCFEEEIKSVNETTIDEHLGLDCYEKINDTELFFKQLHLWLDGLLVPFTGTFGIMGNFLTFLVIKRQIRAPRISKNSVRFNHLLMTLACVDICFILFYTSDITMNIWMESKMSYLWYAYLYRYLVHPCKGLMMSSSIYMVVAISAERYKAICDSLRHRAKSWKYIVYVICISCFQNVRKFFEFDVYPDPEHPFKNKTRYLWQEDLLNNQKYIRFVETEDILMLAVLPIALLIFFNGNIWLQIRASKKFRHKFTPYIGSSNMLDTSSTKRDMLMSQNSIAFESDSEIVGAYPGSTHSSVKFQQFTCKLCGSNARSESWSSMSSDITADSVDTKGTVCFEVCQKQLKLKGKRFLKKSNLKRSESKICQNEAASRTMVPYDMCSDSSILNYNKSLNAAQVKESPKRLSYFGLSTIQRKIRNQKDLPTKSKNANKSNLRSGRGVYISQDQDSDSSISGSSLVCIKDENDSSDDNEVEVDETKQVEEGINNLMREHFEAKNAAENISKSQRHAIFRKIFSHKENEKSIAYKKESEKVEMKPLGKLGVPSDFNYKQSADDEDSEEIRDKPTSLSPFLSGVTVVSEITTNGRKRSIRRKERRLRRRNNNVGVCNECKLRLIGAPLDVRAISDSENSRLKSSFGAKNHPTTQMRSSSFKHSARVKSSPITRNSSSKKRRKMDTTMINNSSQLNLLKKSNINYNVSQARTNAQKNNFIRRSVSVKSESPAAFRRTHSVRCSSQNQETKGYTRRRTTTIGACEGNEIISTPEHQELLQSSPLKANQRIRYVNGQIKVEKLQNNRVIKRTYILGSIVFFFMVFHSGRFGLRIYNMVYPWHRTERHLSACINFGRLPMPLSTYICISISDWLLVLNSSINFIIYCVIENQFWADLRAIFTSCFWRQRNTNNDSSR